MVRLVCWPVLGWLKMALDSYLSAADSYLFVAVDGCAAVDGGRN